MTVALQATTMLCLIWCKLLVNSQVSALPLTDPRDAAQRMLNIPYRIMVIKPFLLLGLAAEYRSRRWVWSTVVWQPSEVYDTQQRTKLTAPETISCSRDVVGAHQNVNGSRDLNTPLSGMVCRPWASTCYR